MNTKPNSRSHRSRIFTSRITLIALVAFALLTLAATTAFMEPPVSGAIFTTDSTCSGVDLNIYANKDDVYVNGGPQAHSGAAGLPDGYYYVQVTAPGGGQLGTSVGSGNDTPVHVTNGVFDQCYQLSAILIKTSDGTPGYDDTTNSGGEYMVWISTVSTFDNSSTKTDNFKVNSVECPEPPCGPPLAGFINVIKFYDANTDGVAQAEEVELAGWKVFIEPGVIEGTYFTPVNVQAEPGDYIVSECEPSQINWFHTTPVIVSPVTVVNGENTTVKFGNVCLSGGTGLTLGFWSNKNGQALFGADDLALMQSLNLRTANGSNFDPANYSQFRNWLLNATATNMAYMLSAQLAAMELNVLNNKVSGGSLVYAPCLIGKGANAAGFISISDLMSLANTSLGTDGYTVAAGATRTYQECLKNALDQANNNLNFVSPTPCPFSNFTCPND
jgi:hypothetical protein